MNNQGKRLEEFHDAVQSVAGCPRDRLRIEYCNTRDAVKNLLELRLRLLEEEFEEYQEAHAQIMESLDKGEPISRSSVASLLDAIVDINVITTGTADSFDFNYDLAFDRVMDNNMTKTGDGAYFRDDGKLMKPANYTPVDLSDDAVIRDALVGRNF